MAEVRGAWTVSSSAILHAVDPAKAVFSPKA